ncbi:MAG: phage head-tail connector protein [Alphaproteobacteria bacterium]|nr:phage head-tail connector protein [Alphaproteobacteria bacterium]
MSDDQSSSLRLIASPANEPLTLAQAKAFLRIEHNADDEPLARAITAARLAAEQFMKMALLPQTWEYRRANPASSRLALPFGPAESVVSVTLTDEAGVSGAADAATYRLSVDGFSLHFNPALGSAQVSVRYIAATAATAAEVPATILQGMLHHITVMMETRDGAAPLPMQSVACYQPFRRIAL